MQKSDQTKKNIFLISSALFKYIFIYIACLNLTLYISLIFFKDIFFQVQLEDCFIYLFVVVVYMYIYIFQK